VKILLENGANPNIKDGDGETPFHYLFEFLENINYECLKAIITLLVEKKADPNMRDNNGRTPLMRAKESNDHSLLGFLENILKIQLNQK
jgi:ankyrin repeat protein